MHGTAWRLSLIAVLLPTSAANAQNYVQWHDREIDVNSIRTGADGITLFESRKREYYEDGVEWQIFTEGVDCARRQIFGSYSIKYEQDWRSKGQTYAPGTMGDDQITFICSRRR